MDYTLSNDELASAIDAAFERCAQKYLGGNYTLTTEPGIAMLDHLKGLLSCQMRRAEMIELPANNKVQPASGQDTRCAGNHEAGSAGTQG